MPAAASWLTEPRDYECPDTGPAAVQQPKSWEQQQGGVTSRAQAHHAETPSVQRGLEEPSGQTNSLGTEGGGNHPASSTAQASTSSLQALQAALAGKKGYSLAFSLLSDHLQMLSHFLGEDNVNQSNFQTPLSRLGNLTVGCQRCSLQFALAAGLSDALLSWVSFSFAVYGELSNSCIPRYFVLTHFLWNNSMAKRHKRRAGSPSDPLSPSCQGAGDAAGSTEREAESPLPSSAQRQRSKSRSGLIHRSQPAAQKLCEDLRAGPHARVLSRQRGQHCPSAEPGDQRRGHQLACWSKMRAGYSTLVQTAQHFSTRIGISVFFFQLNYWQRKTQLSMKIGIRIRP